MSMNRRLTVLVADDDDAVRRAVRRALDGEEYRLLEASGGEGALRLTRDAAPDLVLLDWTMPDLDGLEVLSRLRADWSTRLTPVLIMTGRGRDADKERGLARGADDYLVKPFSPRELRARVRAQLARCRERREASPLTGLPGPEALEREIAARLAAGDPVALLHADLDRFKAFNDAHGFARGDEAIRMAARRVKETAALHGGPRSFVAHIGGDDFALLVSPAEAERAALDLILRFDGDPPGPGLTMSVGAAVAAASDPDAGRLAARAARAKSRLKAAPVAHSRYLFA